MYKIITYDSIHRTESTTDLYIMNYTISRVDLSVQTLQPDYTGTNFNTGKFIDITFVRGNRAVYNRIRDTWPFNAVSAC